MATEAEPYFSQPVRQILTMLLVLALVAAGAQLAIPSVGPVFFSNPWLNGFIAMVFVIGVIATFWQLIQLVYSVAWIKYFTRGGEAGEERRAPRLLAPLAALLRSRGQRMQIGSASARSILDSVATRIEEARDITRYIVSLLIFLGLLGTFYGLATTVPAVVETIRSLAPPEGEESFAVFDRLMQGLDAQLSGMGVAFGSSLLGLAGSLIVGLLELFASHGQNRFYRELEEWLSTITRLGFASGEGEEGGSNAADALPVVLDQIAEQFDGLQVMFERAQAQQAETDAKLGRLAETLQRVAENGAGGADAAAMERIGAALERQAEGGATLARIAEALEEGGAGGIDAESRMRLRSIDIQVLRLLEEMQTGRQESLAELRTDIAALTRAIRQATAGAPVARARGR